MRDIFLEWVRTVTVEWLQKTLLISVRVLHFAWASTGYDDEFFSLVT